MYRSPNRARILTALGFTVTETPEGLACAVPSWRPDVRGEADLVEEVCRIAGLDNVPLAPMERPQRHCAAGAQPVAEAHAGGAAHVGGARLQRSRHLGVPSGRTRQAVRRRPAGTEARQSDLLGTLRHAAVAVAQPHRRRRPQCGAGAWRCHAGRSGPCLCRRPAPGRNAARGGPAPWRWRVAELAGRSPRR